MAEDMDSLGRIKSYKRKFEELDKDTSASGRHISKELTLVLAASAERKGEREDMQDAHKIIHDLKNNIGNINSSIKRLSYFAVFDGHAGARASSYAAENLHKNFITRFPSGAHEQIGKDMKKIIVESFKKTDADFLIDARKVKPVWKDGSTAACLFVIDNTIYIANLGDSKAVLCRYSKEMGKINAIPLTKDHNATVYEERIRIQKAGGFVKDGRVMGQIEVSRSIGDGSYKKHGISCIPDIRKCVISEADQFLILACDGLWKCFSSDTAISYISKILEDKSIEASDSKTELEVKLEIACSQLANEAVRNLSQDNVTVILIYFLHDI